MDYELTIGPEPDDADLQVFEYESLDELVDELTALRAENRDRDTISLAFHPMARPPFSVPEAFAAVVDLLSSPQTAFSQVCCVFATERAKAVASRHLPAGSVAPHIAQVGSIEVQIVCGDITRILADAIVNASNTRLVLGGGVSGAIRGAAKNPAALQAAMSSRAPIEPGDVVATASFGLPMTEVILHAATASGREDVVACAVGNVLHAANRHGLATVAMPALGTGTVGLPVATCAGLMYPILAVHRRPYPKRVIIVLYDSLALEAFVAAFRG